MAMSPTRPEVTAGPMPRNARPVKVSDFSRVSAPLAEDREGLEPFSADRIPVTVSGTSIRQQIFNARIRIRIPFERAHILAGSADLREGHVALTRDPGSGRLSRLPPAAYSQQQVKFPFLDFHPQAYLPCRDNVRGSPSLTAGGRRCSSKR